LLLFKGVASPFVLPEYTNKRRNIFPEYTIKPEI